MLTDEQRTQMRANGITARACGNDQTGWSVYILGHLYEFGLARTQVNAALLRALRTATERTL